MADGVRFNRRGLLEGATVLGLGGLVGEIAQAAKPSGQQPRSSEPGASAKAGLTVRDVYDKAREALHPTCRVCPQCDGIACAGEYPAIGGIGSGASFQNNYTALHRVKLNLRSLTDATRADASVTIFGKRLSFPAMAAPMGFPATQFGKGVPQDVFFDAIIGGCADAGTVGAIGDTPRLSLEGMKSRLDIIRRHAGNFVYCIKPIPNVTILKLMPMIEASGPFVLAIDTDSAGRYAPATPDLMLETKSVAKLRELVRAIKIPLVVKGVMTPDEALKAGEAGAAGIVVSNHGGRVLDHTPGTAEVLPAIADKVKGKMVILTDGCVRYGNDVLKFLALGADAVMIGRHLLRAAYGAGRS